MIADISKGVLDISMYTLFLKAIISDDGKRRINVSHFYNINTPHLRIFERNA